MILNGSQILAEVLIENGVDTVFGYPGGAVLNIYDALYEYKDKITHYMTAHEQGAAHAADGYARATGKCGVVIATSGPGATNLVTGIATAYMDSIPMVAITGNVSTDLIGKDSFQEVYISGITMPITKHNFTVRKIDELADTLRHAFEIAQSGRPGPVLVDIPKDISGAKTESTPKTPKAKEIISNDFDAEKIASIINEAQRPVAYIGGGVKISEAEAEVLEFLKKANIPAVHTVMAAGVLRYDEPKNLGLVGMHGNYVSNKAIDGSDLVIAIGTRFSDRVALKPDHFAPKAKIIHIDIDKSEIKKNVDVDFAVISDVKAALEKINPLLKYSERQEWFEKIAKWQSIVPELKDDGDDLKPQFIIKTVCREVGEDATFVTDVGQHQMWAAQYINHTNSRKFLTSGGLGTMGYGYGAALGAYLGNPGSRVIHLTGDGSFHMNMNEACTAVSYNIPVISIIFNNSVLGMVRQWQTTFYGKRYSSSEPERVTDYAKVAEGFGAKGFSCSTKKEFEKALKEALASGCPCWIECKIDREEKVLPMIPAGKSVDNIIVN